MPILETRAHAWPCHASVVRSAVRRPGKLDRAEPSRDLGVGKERGRLDDDDSELLNGMSVQDDGNWR